MALIQSGATSDILTIDPTSKAARATIYGPDGAPLRYTSTNDRGAATIDVVTTTTAAADVVVWALRNKTVGRTLYVSKLVLQMGFNGAGAATEQEWQVVKYTGVTALTGATAVTALLKRTAITNADLDIGVLDTGITMTGGAAGAAFFAGWWSRVTHSATQAGQFSPPFVLDFGEFPIELAQNEALAIRGHKTQVVGDIISGTCEFIG